MQKLTGTRWMKKYKLMFGERLPTPAEFNNTRQKSVILPNVIRVHMIINCKTLLAAYTVNWVYDSKCMLISDKCKSVMEQIKHTYELLLLKSKSYKISMMYDALFSTSKTIIMMKQC